VLAELLEFGEQFGLAFRTSENYVDYRGNVAVSDLAHGCVLSIVGDDSYIGLPPMSVSL